MGMRFAVTKAVEAWGAADCLGIHPMLFRARSVLWKVLQWKLQGPFSSRFYSLRHEKSGRSVGEAMHCVPLIISEMSAFSVLL